MSANSEVAALQQLLVEARAAVRDKDYATAYDRLVEASVVYDTLPNSEQDGVRMEWRNAEQLLERIKRLRDEQATSGKLKRVPLTYQRPGCDVIDDCYCR